MVRPTGPAPTTRTSGVAFVMMTDSVNEECSGWTRAYCGNLYALFGFESLIVRRPSDAGDDAFASSFTGTAIRKEHSDG